MQANYRTIFKEMLLAQSAATGALAEAAGRYAQLMGQTYHEALLALAEDARPKNPAHPGGQRGMPRTRRPVLADLCRGIAGLPRMSVLGFLSRYDNLRGPRAVVRD